MTALEKAVLIVEDEHLIALGLSVQIEDMGLEVCGTADTAEGAVAQTSKPMSWICAERPIAIKCSSSTMSTAFSRAVIGPRRARIGLR